LGANIERQASSLLAVCTSTKRSYVFKHLGTNEYAETNTQKAQQSRASWLNRK
jgi:hypothetical protein